MIYDDVGAIRDLFKQNLALEIRKNQNKVISILTETYINHDQIHHIKNKWLGPIFSLLEIVTQKDCLSRFIWVLKVSPRLTLIQEGGLHPLRLLLLMTEFSVFMPFKGIAPAGEGGQLARRRFFEGIQNYMEKKLKEKKKKYLETLVVLWLKWTGMVKIKPKDLPCQNSL